MPKRYRKKTNSRKINTAFKIARNNRRMLMGETKCSNGGATGLVTDATGDVMLLTDVDQGIVGHGVGGAVAARIGDMVYAKSLTVRIKGTWQANGLEDSIRILAVQKTGNDDAIPTIITSLDDNEDVLEDSGGAPNILAHPSWVNRKQYRILMDESFIGDPQRLENFIMKRFFKLKHKVYYSNAIATDGAKKGNIYLLTYGGAEGQAGAEPLLDVAFRFTFKDL